MESIPHSQQATHLLTDSKGTRVTLLPEKDIPTRTVQKVVCRALTKSRVVVAKG